jgi:AcrR family transcriptional regulator
VFAEFGFHSASIVKITEAAGVAQGTFYLYFESKQAVFEEVLLDLNHRVRRAMAEGAAGATSRREAERGGFLGFFRFTAEHPALYRVIRQAEFVAPALLERHYAAIADGYVDGLRRAMDDGEIAVADPEVVAWALMAVGEMVGMRWVLWPAAAEIPPAVFEETMAFVTRALGRGPE